MGKKYKYKIGDWVAFKTYLKVNSMEGKRCAHEIGLANLKEGQICGAIVRYLGDIKTHDWDYHSESAFLVVRKAIILYQVKNGMINIPFEVREEDLQKILPQKKLPWKKVQIANWAKKHLSDMAKSQPRDSKGKFVRHHLRVVNQ